MKNINTPEQTPTKDTLPVILVAGVGGAGGNAVRTMHDSGLKDVTLVSMNTDLQALERNPAGTKIALGREITQGLGAGAKPEVGRAAAEESIDAIEACLQGANMVFVVAGMGGGTGTGAAAVVAKTARDMGILTVGVVTKPFHFEGVHRMRLAESGIEELQQYVDTLLIIPNQNLFRIANEKTTFADAFQMADDVLYSGVRGVTDLMVMPGLINLDFADIRSVMSEMGKAMMGTGEASGERRAIEASEAAISNPLLEDVSMQGARGVLVNITGGMDMTLFEVDEACNRIREEVDPEANIIFGSTFDETMEGTMRVSVVATGIDGEALRNNATSKGGSGLRRSGLQNTPRPASAPASRPQTATTAATVAAAAAPRPQPQAAPMPQQPVRQQQTANEEIDQPQTDLLDGQDLQPSEEDMQSQGVAAQRYEDSFIPPQPLSVEEEDFAQPVNEDAFLDMRPATSQRTQHEDGLHAPRHQPQPQPQPQSRRGASLFDRLTGRASGGHQQQAASAHDYEEQQYYQNQAPQAQQATEEDDLDIPAFLRRQAN